MKQSLYSCTSIEIKTVTKTGISNLCFFVTDWLHVEVNIIIEQNDVKIQ